jgi:hypothetical protein
MPRSFLRPAGFVLRHVHDEKEIRNYQHPWNITCHFSQIENVKPKQTIKQSKKIKQKIYEESQTSNKYKNARALFT